MLIVHPSSTCDICLDSYNWTTPTNAPHAIACGHVFCLRCLRLLHPSTCPLCRKAFQPDRIKKLHVDRLTAGNDDDDRTQAEESELIQHVALFFGENTPDEDVNTVLGEAHDWLALRGDNLSSHRALRSAVAALHRYKTLQQESRVDKQTIRDLMEEYDRKIRIKEQDIKTSRAIEEKLLEEIHTIDDKWRSKLERLEAELTSLRSGQTKTPPPFSELPGFSPAESAQSPNIASHGKDPDISFNIPTELPGPSDMSRSQSQSHTHFRPPDMSRAHSISNPLPVPPDMSRMQNISNPLPEPPRPVSPERLASLGRSPAMSNFNIPRSSSMSGSRISVAQTVSDSQPSSTGWPQFQDPRALRRDRSLRTGVLIPGAQQKVVPARPIEPEGPRITPGRTWNPLDTPAPRVPAPEANLADDGIPLRREHDEHGQTVYYQYGWVPGTGYAWFQVPHSSASQASVTPAQSNGTTGSSRNVAATSSIPGSSARGRSIYEQPIVEDNSSSEAGPSSPHANRDRTPSRRSAHRQSSPRRAVESEQSQPSSAQRSHSSTLSNASLRGMTLLNVPPHPSGTVSSAADRQDIMNILGVSTPQVNHTQPSPATTWGTVHSSQVPSRASINPSHNPSVSDLGLLGLPEPTTLVGSSDDDSLSDSSVGDGSDSIDHGQYMTPRSGPLSYGRSVASPEHTQPTHAAQGMGVLLDSEPRHTVRQTIRGPQELQVVTESLMRLVDQDGQDSRADYGTERLASTPNPRDPSEAILGARTGVPLYSSRPQSIRPDIARGSSRSRVSSVHHLDREYMSDSEHVHHRTSHDHHHSHSRHRTSRRQSSLSGEVVVPPPPVAAPSTYHRQPSAPSRVPEREPRTARFESPVHMSTSREHRSHQSAPASAVEANVSLSSLSSLNQHQGGLLLSFTPVAGGSSSAVSVTGQDTAIRAPAPRPISSRSSSLLGGLWNARSGR
ncbi:hypothetical protein DAEQUDRAFT_725181 [Daedalea quercina L-15889]|uniref:RING-type domain-containing protein n=1 Tax=Daedalea quercina L-15889 TaxID=1314783 RepID=A0A165REC2_9APHY|nr:hypothetical protein DAEQUDRAFT_725181 [Daedalea quercina L-15889]